MKYLMLALIILSGCASFQKPAPGIKYELIEVARRTIPIDGLVQDSAEALFIKLKEVSTAATYELSRINYRESKKDLCILKVTIPGEYKFRVQDVGCNGRFRVTYIYKVANTIRDNFWYLDGAGYELTGPLASKCRRIMLSPQILRLVSRWKRGLSLSIED